MTKNCKHNTKEKQHTTREGKNRNNKETEELQKQPENNKMAIDTYFSILNLNVNGLINQKT